MPKLFSIFNRWLTAAVSMISKVNTLSPARFTNGLTFLPERTISSQSYSFRELCGKPSTGASPGQGRGLRVTCVIKENQNRIMKLKKTR